MPDSPTAAPTGSPAFPTFPALLAEALRRDAARPQVTFYDDATGERVELSVTTFANWVSKTAGLVQDELGLERGELVLVDLPTHWLGAVWLGAAWTAGLCVTADRDLADDAALVVCGPERVEAYAETFPPRPVVALSLRPLGARFTEPLPAGVTDYGAVVLGQPDVFVGVDPPGGEDPAWRDGDAVLTQRELLEGTAREPLVEQGGRLLTDRNPATPEGLPTLLAPLQRSGGTVWVAHPDPASWESRASAERATLGLGTGSS